MRLMSCGLAVLLMSAPVWGQRQAPDFLQPEVGAARLATPHLEARPQLPARVGADGRVTVSVLVTPRPKMHVYGADVSGYVPFTVSVEPARGLSAGKVTYPPSELYVFPPTGESSKAYMRPFTVRQTLQLDADLRRALASGTPVQATLSVRYQACDDRVCYRPTAGSLTVDLVR